MIWRIYGCILAYFTYNDFFFKHQNQVKDVSREVTTLDTVATIEWNPRCYNDNSAARWLREQLQRRGAFVCPGFGSWERVARADRSARGTGRSDSHAPISGRTNTCRRELLAIRNIWPLQHLRFEFILRCLELIVKQVRRLLWNSLPV